MVTLCASVFVISVIDVEEDDLHEHGHILNLVTDQFVFVQFEQSYDEHEDDFGVGQRIVDINPPKTQTLNESKPLEHRGRQEKVLEMILFVDQDIPEFGINILTLNLLLLKSRLLLFGLYFKNEVFEAIEELV